MKMVDLRCPRCDREVVKGFHGAEVVLLPSVPKVKSCPHCKALLKVVKTNDDLGEHYYFSPCSTALKK